jgi:SAM-dependent methyltransferase
MFFFGLISSVSIIFFTIKKNKKGTEHIIFMLKRLRNAKDRIKRIGYLKNLIKTERLAHKNSLNAGYAYYESPLSKVNESFNLKLQDQIKNHQQKIKSKNYHVLDIGAGNGLTISQLEGELAKRGINISATATGIAKNPEWKKHPNSKKINWITSESEILSRKIKPNSIDFAYSNFGVRYAQDVKNALREVHKVLKKGGRFVFTYRGKFGTFGPAMIPKGFKSVGRSSIHHQEYIDQDATHQTVVYYIEKI